MNRSLLRIFVSTSAPLRALMVASRTPALLRVRYLFLTLVLGQYITDREYTRREHYWRENVSLHGDLTFAMDEQFALFLSSLLSQRSDYFGTRIRSGLVRNDALLPLISTEFDCIALRMRAVASRPKPELCCKVESLYPPAYSMAL